MAELREVAKHALDAVTIPVAAKVAGNGLVAIGLGRYDGQDAMYQQVLANDVAIIALVGEQGLGCDDGDRHQGIDDSIVGRLPASQDEAGRASLIVAAGVDLARKAVAGSTKSVHTSPFSAHRRNMAANRGAVDHMLPVVRQPQFHQYHQDSFPYALFDPAPKLHINRVLQAVPLMHVATRTADTQHVQHPAEETPVVMTRPRFSWGPDGKDLGDQPVQPDVAVIRTREAICRGEDADLVAGVGALEQAWQRQ